MSRLREWKDRRTGRVRAGLVAAFAAFVPGAGLAAIHGLDLDTAWRTASTVPLPIRVTPAIRDDARARLTAVEPVAYAILNRDATTIVASGEHATSRIARFATPPQDEDASAGGAVSLLVPVGYAVPASHSPSCALPYAGLRGPVSYRALSAIPADKKGDARSYGRCSFNSASAADSSLFSTRTANASALAGR